MGDPPRWDPPVGARMSRRTFYGPTCGRRGCLCTHTAPCDYGWFDAPDLEQAGQTYARTQPCPTCRPELATRISNHIRATSRNS